MEYDPASPTDEPEETFPQMDLSSIPLPGALEKPGQDIEVSFLNDIPLPPGADSSTSSIPLPPISGIKQEVGGDGELKTYTQAHTTATSSKEELNDSGPLKFSLKAPKQLTGQENSSESSGVFESTRDLKSEEPRAMPKLQAMMKRSKPCQLPVGVLPSKTKLPATEVKTELFLPTKESENSNQVVGGSLPTMSSISSLQSTDPSDSLTNAIKEINALNSLAQMTSVGLDKSAVPAPANPSSVNGAPTSLPMPPGGLQIPNLMSLSVQPVHPGTQGLSLVNSVSTVDPVPVVKPAKVPPTSMQFVNPQKFRSAQMIATPLIANPAVAAQSQQNDEQPKSKDNRRRGRSRSRSRRRSRGHRRSRSRHRSDSRRRSRHRRSSSSRSSSHHRSTRRRSRSRRTPKDRHRGHRDRERQKASDRDRHSTEKSKDDALDSKKTRKVLKRESSERERTDEKALDKVTIKDESRSKERIQGITNVDTNINKSDTPPKVSNASEDRNAGKNNSKSDHKSRVYRSNKYDKIDDRHTNRSSLAAKKSRSPEETTKKESHERSRMPSVKAPSPLKGTLADLIKRDRDAKSKHAYRRSAVESSDSDSDSSEADLKHHSKQIKKPKRKESSSSSDTSSSADHDAIKPQIIPKKNVDSRRYKDEESPRKRHQSSHTSKSMTLDKGSSFALSRGGTPTVPTPDNDDMELGSDVEFDAGYVDNFETDDDSQSCAGGELLATVNDLFATIISSVTPDDNYVQIPEADDLPSGSPQQGEESNMNLQNVTVKGPSILTKEVDCNESVPISETKYDLRKRKNKPESRAHLLTARALDACLAFDFDLSSYSESIFARYPDAPAPQYSHIFENDYGSLCAHNLLPTTRSSHCSAKLLGSSGSRSSSLQHDMRQWICDCTLPSPDELDLGLLACGPGCINRSLNIECGSLCPAQDFCSNRQFQKRIYAPTEPFYAGPDKGWGLKATSHIPKGSFIIEYVGEAIDFSEFRRRVRRYERLGQAHHYFMALESDRFIDAGSKGNWARFVNHSCEPNSVTQKWCVDGDIRIGFFAKEDISAGQEITIDYQFVQFGASEQKCYCGTASCSGMMGATSKQLQEKVRLKDTAMVERRILQLLQLDNFRHAEDITLLLQVMVQECLTRYTRMELLKRLASTNNDACLKLFRQYNGLDMLAALMCDAGSCDWELKRQILVCLDHIPVSEQKQVQSNSRLMDIVSQWTVDPRYCRSRTCDSTSGPKVCPPDSPERASKKPESADFLDSVAVHHDEDVCKLGKSNVFLVRLPNDVFELHDSSGYFPQTNDDHTVNGGCRKSEEMDCVMPEEIRSDCGSSPLTPISSPCSLKASCNTPLSCNMGDESTLQATLQADEVSPVASNGRGILPSCTMEVSDANCDTNGSMVQNERAGNQQSECELIKEIQILASRLIDKWSKLPKENYRIPRLERQETEQILNAHTSGSPLVSWGFEHKSDCSLSSVSWTQGDVSKSLSTKTIKSKSSNQSSKKTPELNGLSKLSKEERRQLFEAQVRETEARLNSEKTDSPTKKSSVSDSSANLPPTALERLSKLLLCALLKECDREKSVTSALASNRNEELKHLPVLTILLKTLPCMLTNLASSKDANLLSSLCEVLRDCANNNAQNLPPGWRSAADPSGRIYYYNVETKAVQWEKPTLDGKNTKTETTHQLKEDREEKEKQFTREVGNYILRLLRPYRLPNCLTGRIESNDDFVHVTKKFTYSFVSRELKRCRFKDPPSFTQALQDRIRSSVTRYMTSRGAVYQRKHRKLQEKPEN